MNRRRFSAKTLALAVVYAGLYAVLTVMLAPLSYLAVQVRVSDALVALIPLLGWGGILGHTVGVFIANLFSTAGGVDLLNTIPSFAMAVVVWKLRNRSVIAGTLLYSVVLGATVGVMLSYLYGFPQLETILYVFVGIAISATVIGYPLYKAIKKIAIHLRWITPEKT
ncbi:MAG: QueT transporter family protein [Candidatus Bathyarchaeota archaeon]|nr:QueT transporter family protein [Candidatus Bathyarchaeota archaeon]